MFFKFAINFDKIETSGSRYIDNLDILITYVYINDIGVVITRLYISTETIMTVWTKHMYMFSVCNPLPIVDIYNRNIDNLDILIPFVDSQGMDIVITKVYVCQKL